MLCPHYLTQSSRRPSEGVGAVTTLLPQVGENLDPDRLGDTSKVVQPRRLSEKPVLINRPSVSGGMARRPHISESPDGHTSSPTTRSDGTRWEDRSPGICISLRSTGDSTGHPMDVHI